MGEKSERSCCLYKYTLGKSKLRRTLRVVTENCVSGKSARMEWNGINERLIGSDYAGAELSHTVHEFKEI